MKNTIFHNLKPLLLALVLSIGISYTYAAWSPPTATPTGGNTDAPVNVGNATQVKAGALTVNGLLTAVANVVVGGTIKVGNIAPSGTACTSSIAGSIKYDGTDLMGCVDAGGVFNWKSLTATGGGGASCPTGTWSRNVPGTYTITMGTDIPSCVTVIKTVELWGGGGGGAAGSPNNYGAGSGGGGGGGGYGYAANYVIPSGQTTFPVVVGSGGTGGTASFSFTGSGENCQGGSGGSIGNSSFGPFVAFGGSGAPGTSGEPLCPGGAGGSASGPGMVITPGGNGGNGDPGFDSGGAKGGDGANGGIGGAGAPLGGNPGNGNPPGGGGGGGFAGYGNPSANHGANGAPGQVKITW